MSSSTSKKKNQKSRVYLGTVFTIFDEKTELPIDDFINLLDDFAFFKKEKGYTNIVAALMPTYEGAELVFYGNKS